ncbi:partner and localizer of BRCA2 isoform X2 [Tenrec ecaudatus]|uniref:partner and localizer of BRCA2 isoform X2 n=1 Tax=Tenrec ecaudatus TaxID=94439 RepID=UPI003F59B495
MEEPPGKPLTCEEKEKLKEKLAYLKREYSKTLARLQRAQKAEKVKDSVKKRVEQNCSLQQGISPSLNHSEPRNKVYPQDRLQISTRHDEETGEKTCFTPDIEPDSFNLEDGPVEDLHRQRTDGIQEHFSYRVNHPDDDKRHSKLPGGKKQQQKRTIISQDRKSLLYSDSLMLSRRRLQGQEQLNGENPKTPVSEIRPYLSSPEPEVPHFPALVTETNGRDAVLPRTAQPERSTGGPIGETSFPKVTTVLSHTPLDNRSGQQLEGMPPSASCKLTQRSTTLPLNGEPRDQTLTVPTKSPVVNTDKSANDQLLKGPRLAADKSPFVNEHAYHNVSASQTQNLKDQSLSGKSLKPNIFDGRYDSLQENEALCSSESLSLESICPVSAENETHSCAVLEGLLFPAEYYVRTTRSMSNRQRNGALEAVIQSHLHDRRKGLKKKIKATKKLNLSYEEADESRIQMSDSWAGRPSSRIPVKFLSLTEPSCPTSPASDNDFTRKSVTQASNRNRRKIKAVCNPVSDDQELILPTSGTSGVNRTKEETLLHKEQKEKEVFYGKEGHSQKENSMTPRSSVSYLALDRDTVRLPLPVDEMLSSKQRSSLYKITDFQLPDEDFGSLKLKKLKPRSEQMVYSFESKMCAEKHREEGKGAVWEELIPKQMDVETGVLGKELFIPAGCAHPKMSNLQAQPKNKGLSSSMIRCTPLITVTPEEHVRLTADMCSSSFPILGSTPLVGSQAPCKNVSTDVVGRTYSTCQPSHVKDTISLTSDAKPCNNSIQCLNSGAGPQVSQRKGQADCCVSDSQAAPLSMESSTAKGSQLPGSARLELCEDSVEQTEFADLATCDSSNPGSLQLVSKLQNPAGSCSVDVSTMWWESAGYKESCIITACEYAVSLWKPLDTCQWEKIYTWHFTEVPVLQIVSMPDMCNIVCVALGNLEIREIRALFYSSTDVREKQVLLKSGNIKAVLGLTKRRLVSSSGTLYDQQVEVMRFSEDGGNLKTGQLLKKMHMGDSCQASVCHKAYAEMGLLFVVLSHPRANKRACLGSPVFQLSVINPRTALSVGVMLYCLPQGQAGRFLEGEVKGNLAAAVLTSGTIAVWDLLLGRCTALLPPVADQNWSFVKWSDTDSHLLAGQKDGTVFVYRY